MYGRDRRPPVGTRGPQGRATTYRPSAQSSRRQGNADWSAGLRPASRPAGPRNRIPLCTPTRHRQGNADWSAGQFSRWGPPAGTRGPQGREPRTAPQRNRPAGKGTPTSGQFSRWGPARAARRAAQPRIAPLRKARAGKGTPTSGRHARRGPAYRSPAKARPGKGTPASGRHPAGPRTANRPSAHSSRRQGNADLRPVLWGPARAARRAAQPRIALLRKARAGKGTPASGRHRVSMGFENVPLLGFENVPLFRGDWVPAEGWVDGIWRGCGRIGGGG